MKKHLLILLLCLAAGGAVAQTHKLTIYSYFSDSNVNVQYLNYDKLYPDSIKTAVMVDYKKQYQLKNTNTLLLRMSLDGWKLVTTVVNASGFQGNVSSSIQYIMSREILLDDAAMDLYLQNLKKLK